MQDARTDRHRGCGPARRACPLPVGMLFSALALAALLAGACGPPSEGSAAPVGTVRVYFVGGGMDPCGDVAPVMREIGEAVGPAAALRELLRGPTEEESEAGFTSLFGPATADALQDVVVVDGIARVSFRDLRPLLPSASSSCGSAALLAALDATLAQLPGIRAARYSFGGDEVAFYEWLQVAPPN